MEVAQTKARTITRNRPSLSCLPCRRRKVKCDKQHPVCESCSKVGETCIYASDDKSSSKAEKRRHEDPKHGDQVASTQQVGSNAFTSHQATFTNRPVPSHAYQPSFRPQRESQLLEGGYFFSSGGARTKYVEKTFWAFLKDNEVVTRDLLTETYHDRTGLGAVWPHIDIGGLATLSKTLPSKTICDFCMRAFMTCVRPVLPLVHEHTFVKDYENFFRIQQEEPDKITDEFLIDDPTILSTICAALYCGAMIAPSSFWKDEDVQDVSRKEVVTRLSSIYHSAMSYCRASHHPTLNTLTAMVLGESCSTPQETSLADVGLASVMLKVAQHLGLHRDRNQRGLDAVSAEIRRRVWWHIQSIDLCLTVSVGSTLSCSLPNVDVKMIRDVADRELSHEAQDGDPLLLPVGPSWPSLLFTTARFEVVRYMKPIIETIQIGRQVSQQTLNDFMYSIKMLHGRLDDLMQRIAAKGVPEKGQIPSRIAGATPVTHPWLYQENTNEATVFGCWARIMMHMMKLESAMILMRALLDGGNGLEVQWLWANAAKFSCDFLRAYLQVQATMAFEPYRWFHPTRCQPLQPTLMVLVYLQRWPDTQLYSMALYLVDEILDQFCSGVASADNQGAPDPMQATSKKTLPEWKMLRATRDKLKPSGSHAPPPASPSAEPNTPGAISRGLDLNELVSWSTALAGSLGT